MKLQDCIDCGSAIAAIFVLLCSVYYRPGIRPVGRQLHRKAIGDLGRRRCEHQRNVSCRRFDRSAAVGNTNNGSFSVDGGFWPAAAPCISLDRDHQSFPASGGGGSISLSGLAACSWTAVSNNQNFVTVNSGGSGSGDGTVQFSVGANAGSTIRSGTITVAGQTFTVYQGIDFLDVPSNDLFYTDIGKLASRGVTLGCGNGNYCPNDPVTREQMAAFIMRALGESNPPVPPLQRFSDVPPSNIFYNFIDRLAVLQITLGCTPDHAQYCPGDPVKREQMAAFLLRALGEFTPPHPSSQRFTDVPSSNTFYSFIDRMAVVGITLGCNPDHTLYCPGANVTGAQMAAFLVRAFRL